MTKEELKNEINQQIYENTTGDITGERLNGVLIDMVETLYNSHEGTDPAIEELEQEFENYKNELSGRLETIREEIENSTSESVGNAMNQLSQMQGELSDISDRLSDAADAAQSALDAARALSGLTLSGITDEMLQEILALNDEVRDWMEEFSGKVGTLMSEYDDINGQLGEIGVGLSTAEGKIGLLTTNVNTISGTVGTVKSEWDASKGNISDVVTWYNQSAGTYAEIVSTIDGLNARIENTVSYYIQSGDGVNFLSEYVDGKLAEFGRTIEVSGVDLTYIEERINGLSGTVSTAITRYDGMSGTLVTINSRMDAMAGELTTSLTKAESALTEAHDLREIWSVESGIIRTVSDLVIKTDANGDPIYWYIDPDLENPSDKTQWIRVYYMGEDANTGLPYYNTNKDGSGTRYDSNVFPDYLSAMVSYITQQSDKIELNVTSGDVLSALRLEVTSGGSVIYMTADRVVIDSDIIANSLTTKSADIGGVHIGAGMISAQTGNNKWALSSDGTLEATNAKIKGSISADSGYFKGAVSADSGYFKGKVEANEGYFKGSVSATSGYFSNISASNITINNSVYSGSVYGDITANSLTLGTSAIDTIEGIVSANSVASATVRDYVTNFVGSQGFVTNSALNGYVSQEDFDEWVDVWNASHSANPLTSAEVQTIAERVVGAEISDFVSITQNADGSYTHTMNVGGTDYTWTTYDAGKYLLVGNWKGDSATTGTGFMVSTNGLLRANNAIIYGTVYASAGRFQGDITANTLMLGSQSITDYIAEQIPESADGLDEGEVNTLIASAANINNWVVSGDLKDWVVLGTTYGTTSAVTISKQGLLVAKNAIISGSVYADRGVFNGDVYANNGTFNGAITATSLSLGTSSQNTIKNIVTANSVDSTWVENQDYATETYATNAAKNEAKTASGKVVTWVTNKNYAVSAAVKNLLTNYASSAVVKNLIDNIDTSEVVTVASSTTTNGVTRHTITVGNKSYAWDTIDADEYLILGDAGTGSGTIGGSGYKSIIHKNGLLEANNAIIYGKIYASEGEFKGSISADSGYFKGDVVANHISAQTGYFAGFIRMPYIKIVNDGNSVLSHTGTTYSASWNYAYLYYDPQPMGGGDTLVLPTPSDAYNGFMFDILVPPRISRSDGADSLKIRAANNSAIFCYAFNDQFSSTALWLTGGHYKIVCTWGYQQDIIRWCITEASGAIMVLNGSSIAETWCTPTSYVQNGERGDVIGRIVAYSGTKPSILADNKILYISTD